MGLFVDFCEFTCFTKFSQFEQLKKITNFLLVPNSFFSVSPVEKQIFVKKKFLDSEFKIGVDI